MTSNEYQNAALATKNYETPIIYPSLGIVGEAGEVAEKVKKLHRDFGWNVNDKIPEDHRKEIALELGDVCWYAAVLSNDLGFNLSSVVDFNRLDNYGGSITTLIVLLSVTCGKLAQESVIESRLDDQAFVRLFSLVRVIASELGFSLDDILEMNIAKLASRKQRGVISGNGDFR